MASYQSVLWYVQSSAGLSALVCISPNSQMLHNVDRRFRTARYITAALTAVFVVSTLWYIQIPAVHPPSDRFSFCNDPPSPAWQRPITPSSPVLWDARAAQVQEAYLHAYEGYLKYAETILGVRIFAEASLTGDSDVDRNFTIKSISSIRICNIAHAPVDFTVLEPQPQAFMKEMLLSQSL
ncbi:hypothetical protein L226DRAFT_574804 [Lentinus tigrinus ALCF2SS1-7]|uniref:uncharacterized protein n=1 Tax=Lentinus tigrinus ALCF2SS1-7 TaxID=1328758 RepID=UPI0011660B66|nr:hypothetical protein L226DRAFT_574804 [Lentinus tigrinus ALCF2SS1-7]